MRKYQPIWERIKEHSTVSLVAPVTSHRRIIQAVRKERSNDFGWIYEQSRLGIIKPKLIVIVYKEQITFELYDKRGIEVLGI